MVEYRAYWRLVYPTMLALWVIVAYFMLPIMATIGLKKKYGAPFWLLAPIIQLSFQLVLPTIVLVSIFQGRGPFRRFKGRQGKRSIRSIGRRLCFVGICVACALPSSPDVMTDQLHSKILVSFIPLVILLLVLAGGSIRRWFVRTWPERRRRQS